MFSQSVSKGISRNIPCLILLLALGTPQLQAHGMDDGAHIVVVSPVSADSVANGQVLLETVRGVHGAPGMQYLIKIEPGFYDLGAASLEMKPWVDIEGSGRDRTMVRGQGISRKVAALIGYTRGTVLGADNAELRELTVVSSGRFAALAIVNEGVSPRIVNVKAVAEDALQCWGIRNLRGGRPSIEQVSIAAHCTKYNAGISSKAGSRPRIEDTTISSRGAAAMGGNIGVSAGSDSVPLLMRDLDITAGDETAPGIGIDVFFADGTDPFRLEESRIATQGGIGINVESSCVDLVLTIRRSQIEDSATGIHFHGQTLETLQSFIDASDHTVMAETGDVRICLSQLSGGPVVVAEGEASCAGVYDENFALYPDTCY